MELNLRELAENRTSVERYLVEAVIDHEMSPGDPETDTIAKGRKGIAYDIWMWGDTQHIAVAVEWGTSPEFSYNYGCNYFQGYDDSINQIRFLKELSPGEHYRNKQCACNI